MFTKHLWIQRRVFGKVHFKRKLLRIYSYNYECSCPLYDGILVSSKLKMYNLLYFSTKIKGIVLYLANQPKWSILQLSACVAWVKSHKYV